MNQVHDIYDKFPQVKRNIDNFDLCHISQIQFIDAKEIIKDQENFIPDVIDLFEKKQGIILCNLYTLRFLSGIRDTVVKQWERNSGSSIWFLGTTLAKSNEGIDVFPILDGYSFHPSFRYITSNIYSNDRIAVFR